MSGAALMREARGMTEDEKNALLGAFEKREKKVALLAVLGGAFAEGVDLAGERLENVIVVSTGLPQPDVRVRAMQRYHDESGADGYFLWHDPAGHGSGDSGGGAADPHGERPRRAAADRQPLSAPGGTGTAFRHADRGGAFRLIGFKPPDLFRQRVVFDDRAHDQQRGRSCGACRFRRGEYRAAGYPRARR